MGSARYRSAWQYGDTVDVALDVGDAAREREAVGEPEGASDALGVGLAVTLRVDVGEPMGWSHAMTTRPACPPSPADAA